MGTSGKRILFSILVLIGLAVIGFSVHRKTKTHRLIAEELSSDHWLERCNEFAGISHNKGRIIFIGNSITEAFDLSVFGDSTIVNFGINGDFTEGLLKRIHQVLSLQPSKLFIEIGINDIFEKVPPEEIIENYEKIIEQVQKGSPGTKIYIQSNTPVSKEGSFFTSAKSLNNTVREQNEQLKKLAVKYNVTYIDLYSHFVIDGALDRRLTRDGLHPNNPGYAVWKEVLIPYLSH